MTKKLYFGCTVLIMAFMLLMNCSTKKNPLNSNEDMETMSNQNVPDNTITNAKAKNQNMALESAFSNLINVSFTAATWQVRYDIYYWTPSIPTTYFPFKVTITPMEPYENVTYDIYAYLWVNNNQFNYKKVGEFSISGSQQTPIMKNFTVNFQYTNGGNQICYVEVRLHGTNTYLTDFNSAGIREYNLLRGNCYFKSATISGPNIGAVGSTLTYTITGKLTNERGTIKWDKRLIKNNPPPVDQSSPFQLVNVQQGTYNIYGQVKCTNHYYWATKQLITPTFQNSNTIQLTVDYPPAAPSINSTWSNNHPKIYWTTVPNTTYMIYRATAMNGTYQLIQETSSSYYIDNTYRRWYASMGKDNLLVRYYKIKAKNQFGTSGFSNIKAFAVVYSLY